MELRILTEGVQCLPCGDKLKAGDRNVGKRQKQAHHHEQENKKHFKRDGAALIQDERAHELTSTPCMFFTKHRGLISNAMLRNWNTQGNCAEAGLLRKEFGILGLRYAGLVRSRLPVSGIAALRPVSRFLPLGRVVLDPSIRPGLHH